MFIWTSCNRGKLRKRERERESRLSFRSLYNDYRPVRSCLLCKKKPHQSTFYFMRSASKVHIEQLYREDYRFGLIFCLPYLQRQRSFTNERDPSQPRPILAAFMHTIASTRLRSKKHTTLFMASPSSR